MKKEMAEHQHIISSHYKEMQELRDSLSLAMERFTSLSNKNDQDLKDFKTYAVCTIGVLNQKLMANERQIAEQKDTIDSLYKQLLSFQELSASKIDLEKSKKDIEIKINDSTNIHLNSFQDFQRELKILYNTLKEEVTKAISLIDHRLTDSEDKNEENFSIFRIDKDGILKEVRVYKMDMFYIEKKIENIYTLIERLKNKTETR